MRHLTTHILWKPTCSIRRLAGLVLLLGTVLFGVQAHAQLVRVPTKAETRKKQKELSSKKNDKMSRSASAAPSNNPLGKQMTRQSIRRNSGQSTMLVPVRDPKNSLDVNNPRNINLNTQPVERPRRSNNAMGKAMLKQSMKANGSAKGVLVPGPAYREKMMKKRDKKFAKFRGEGNTLSMPDRKKMYKKKSKELSSYKGDLLVRKRPQGAYPNLKYRGGYKNSSFEKKEKYRKRVLKRMGKKQLKPAHMRRKDEKPRYDSREAEIWDKPR